MNNRIPSGNDDPNTNGELTFLNSIKDDINVIFDVGCRWDTMFTMYEKDVHYFEPLSEHLEKLKLQDNKNTKTHFNNFGLSNVNETIPYHPKIESFYHAEQFFGVDPNVRPLDVKTAKDYIVENGIKNIDFLKIDTEGYELNVLKGFFEHLKMVKIVQFEYGGTYRYSGLRLVDVVNYLKEMGFGDFSYLSNDGLVPLVDYNDHYQYSNIVCYNKTK